MNKMNGPKGKRPGSEESKFLSSNVGNLAAKIKKYKQNYSKLWWKSKTDLPYFGKVFSEIEQEQTEHELFQFIDKVDVKLKKYSEEEKDKDAYLEEFVKGLEEFGRKILRLSDVNLDLMFNRGFIDSTRMFVENAQMFDPSMKIENIYQALRNVWIMNSLQVYMDIDIKYSDAIFAYSMIYPYTDNYLDDISESVERKFAFNARLRNWLEGQHVSYRNPQEEKILRLIKLIEKQYDRDVYQGVFQSLLAIFNAQIKSLIQQKKLNIPDEDDILDISLEKGGTSVLADGFLVNGNLSEEQADFCFGFGVLLQLADDVQDVAEDKKNKHITVFSKAAEQYPLDGRTNKLFNFISKVLDLKLDEQTYPQKNLKEIILKCCYYLALEAVGKNEAYYSRDYVKKIQCHFPVRFPSLKKMKKTVKERFLDERRYVIDLNLISTALLTIASRTISE